MLNKEQVFALQTAALTVIATAPTEHARRVARARADTLGNAFLDVGVHSEVHDPGRVLTERLEVLETEARALREVLELPEPAQAGPGEARS